MTTKKQRMNRRIEKHGMIVNAIFNTGHEPVALAKKLRSLEAKASKAATDYCNGDISTEAWEGVSAKLEAQLIGILGPDSVGHVFINSDCRGYALKIDCETFPPMFTSGITLNGIGAIYKDWGGYGILSPDLTNTTAYGVPA